MKVSIIIPLYNKAPYVTKALDSVLAQTVLAFTDYECIIVNDGSTDNSEAVVQSWLSQNSQYTIHFTLYTQENAGVSAARNHGISLSTGDYVAFLDADDWWEPECVEEMIGLVDAYPKAGIWACNYWYVKNGKNRIGINPMKIEDCRLQIDGCENGYINYPKAYYTTGNMPIWTGAVMISREVLENVKCKMRNGTSAYFPLGITLGEDFLLWARIAMRYPVAFLNKPLAYYNNDVLTSHRLTRNLHAPEEHMLWHIDEIADCRLNVPKAIADCEVKRDWKVLVDWLLVNGMMEYWLDERYHEAAKEELKKIDKCLLLHADCAGNMQETLAKYKQPLFWLKLKRTILKIGSYIKQIMMNNPIVNNH